MNKIQYKLLQINYAILVIFCFNKFPSKGYALIGDHVCYDEETYTELEQLKTTQPVKVRSYNWCFSFPPRCSNYRTEIKEVIKLQNITKSRLIERCCNGYVEFISPNGNGTTCSPICRGGCGYGYCDSPNSCMCNIGYEGQHCTERCRSKMFGQNCKSICKCRNGALCDHKTGYCRCNAGWIGDFCETPCTPGSFGLMCSKSCDCPSRKCNAQSGECLNENSQIVFDWSGNNSSNVMRISDERIKVKHWIPVNGNGKLNIKNCTKGEICTESKSVHFNNTEDKIVHLIGKTHAHHLLAQKNNTIMINALNSSITNLTNDVDKLSKQVSDQQDEIKRVNKESQIPKMAILLNPSPIVTQNSVPGETILDDGKAHETDLQHLAMATTGNVVEMPSTGNVANVAGVMGEMDGLGVAGVDDVETFTLNQHVEQSQQLPSSSSHQLSVIETGGTVQQNILQGNDGVVTQEMANQNQIVHVFGGIIDIDSNHTVGDRQSQTENSQIVSHIILGLIILIVISLIAFGLLCSSIKKRKARQRIHVDHENQQENLDLTDQVGQKPLPEIPSFTHSITRRIIAGQQDFYDRPLNNLSVRENLNKLDNIEPLYARSRKQSTEHIYDEISYTGNLATTQQR